MSLQSLSFAKALINAIDASDANQLVQLLNRYRYVWSGSSPEQKWDVIEHAVNNQPTMVEYFFNTAKDLDEFWFFRPLLILTDVFVDNTSIIERILQKVIPSEKWDSVVDALEDVLQTNLDLSFHRHPLKRIQYPIWELTDVQLQDILHVISNGRYHNKAVMMIVYHLVQKVNQILEDNPELKPHEVWHMNPPSHSTMTLLQHLMQENLNGFLDAHSPWASNHDERPAMNALLALYAQIVPVHTLAHAATLVLGQNYGTYVEHGLMGQSRAPRRVRFRLDE